MSYDRIVPRIEQLEAEVAGLLAEAEQVDETEDTQFGEDRRGDEIPAELARLRVAKAQIVQDAAEKAAMKARTKTEEAGKSLKEREQAADDASRDATPELRAQRSFTDPAARIMKTNYGFVYAYNAQATVDEDHQIVLAAQVRQQATDVQQFEPMLGQTVESLAAAGIDQAPDVVLADAGYCSEHNLCVAEGLASRVLIATGRQRHGETFPVESAEGSPPEGASRRERMAHELRTEHGHGDYAGRKAIVEAVFGQMKTRQNAGGLRLRGLACAQGEWQLHALCHNLRKLRNATTAGILPRIGTGTPAWAAAQTGQSRLLLRVRARQPHDTGHPSTTGEDAQPASNNSLSAPTA